MYKDMDEGKEEQLSRCVKKLQEEFYEFVEEFFICKNYFLVEYDEKIQVSLRIVKLIRRSRVN